MDIQRTARPGWIEVIAGSMFSGKSEELIRRLRRAQIAKLKVQIFKPAIDTRYSQDEIVSHSEMKIPSETVRTSAGPFIRCRSYSQSQTRLRRRWLSACSAAILPSTPSDWLSQRT